MSAYQPDRGDFVFMQFSPQSGAEQAGHRPALIVSPRRFNVATGLAFACPVTNQMKGSPFEVSIPATARITGVVLAHQLRSLDWLARSATYHSTAPDALTEEVMARVQPILFA